ncbi:LytR family transcriptional regulator [Streptomyces sp. SID5785]|uniref:LCP family protein n=1 Tax=Streptomyces sp. SID5785 TaxID=2690309 RepID=UPI0013619ABB|nr:LCP family protein [Streptomyces sp. SID5785]MZD06031.1 LytR family transcriptional regulator [Streptomyces sp. SID5785]
MKQHERKAKRRGGRVTLACGALALGLLAFGGAAAGPVAAALPSRVDVFGGLTDRPAAGPGTNVLLMGTDGRDTISRTEKETFHAGGAACGCSDVMMLVHVSRDHDRISVVSLPRDSYADIPGSGADADTTHPAKLNAAYKEGGPALAVRTVESMTGLRVDHFLQLDFRRFMDSVDALDGVDVCTSRQLTDSATHLDLAPGRHHLAGGPALQYVRSRHVDNSADLGRIQRQHRFLVNALRSDSLRDVLGDPRRALEFVSTALGPQARVDQGFTPGDLLSLARDLRQVPLSRTEFGTVPIAGFNHVVEGVGSTLRWDGPRAAAMFGTLREDRALTPADSDTRPLDPPQMTVQTIVHGDTLACA